MNNKNNSRSLAFLLLVCFCGGLVFIGPAVADERPDWLEKKEVTIISKSNRFSGKKMPPPRFDHEGEEIDQMVGLIAVKRPKRKKGQRKLDHVSYRFNGRTLVRNAKGERMSMKDLPVPCKARIYFYPNDRKAPVLYEIDLIGRYKNSSKRWNEDHKKE
jgi:hypothetical protein